LTSTAKLAGQTAWQTIATPSEQVLLRPDLPLVLATK
jgi:hypothetical protein